MNILNQLQIDSLTAYVQEELRKRSFFCKIKIEEAINRDKHILKLTSEKFNTIPVIHSEIELSEFVSSVRVRGIDYIERTGEGKVILSKDVKAIYIEVYAIYTGNCTKVLTVEGFFNGDREYFYNNSELNFSN